MVKFATLCLLPLFFPSVWLQCDENSWKCGDGHCIDVDALCDGKPDCKDNSDEVSSACLAIQCPKYSFRCAYGACISSDLECNGQKDCLDNSDETSAKCPKTTRSLNNKRCILDEYRCADGTCIPEENVCDGHADCSDASDEILKVCASVECPAYAFRCAYGGCINGELSCDGKNDCIDGSDEDKDFCERQSSPVISNRDKPVSSVSKPTNGCLVVFIPYLQVKLVSANKEIKSWEYVGSYQTIKYSCPKGFFLEGSKGNFCEEDKWSHPLPKCTKYCDPIEDITILATCEFNKQSVPCNRNIKPGTRAKISCNIYYREPLRTLQKSLYCQEDGEWDYATFRCEQICGEKTEEVTPFISMGEKTKISRVPWHVGIYSNLRGGPYGHICGGTIITPKLIISAAHCFFNDSLAVLNDKSYYTIAAGKYLRSYTARENNPVQFSNISDIIIPRTYAGADYNFVSDVAVLVLVNNIQYSFHIRPACLEWLSAGDTHIPSGLTGIVAGWGAVESGINSKELLSVEIPTLSRKDCQTKANPEQVKLVTSDKFCIDSRSGGNVCSGDSGGGFLIPRKIKDVNYFYLWGVVSTGLTNLGDCDRDFVTTFTNVQYYRPVIEQAMEDYKY